MFNVQYNDKTIWKSSRPLLEAKKEVLFNLFNLLTLFWRQSVGNFLVSFPISKFKVDQKVYKKNSVKFFNQIQSFTRKCTFQYNYSIVSERCKRQDNINLDCTKVLQKFYYQSIVFLNKK